MAVDEEMAERIRELIGGEPGLGEKRMFGGLAFLVGGHMAVAASGRGGLLVRVPPQDTERLQAEPHAGPMVMRGRELDGWLRLQPEAVASRRQLERWVAQAVSYARSLPPKGR